MRKSLDYVNCSPKLFCKKEFTVLNEKASIGPPDSGLIQRTRKNFDNIDSLDQSFCQSKIHEDNCFHVNLCHQTATDCPNKDDLILE